MKENVFVEQGKALVGEVRCDGGLGRDMGRAVEAIGGLGRLVEPGETIMGLCRQILPSY